MTRVTIRRAVLLAALIPVAGLLAACDGSPDIAGADLENGKQKFSQSCAACHALDDAGTPSPALSNAAAGPNLDDAFRGSREQGFKESQFAGVVLQWIEQPQFPMPAELVTGADAEDVAAYIARVAGTSPDSTVRPARDFVTRSPVPGGQPVSGGYPLRFEDEKIAGDRDFAEPGSEHGGE